MNTRKLLYLFIALCAAAPATRPAAKKNYATPADVVAAAQQARQAKDWATWVDCFTPKALEDQVGLMIAFEFLGGPEASVTASSQPAGSPDEKKTIEKMNAVFKKYGLKDQKKLANEDDEKFITRLTKRITNKRAFAIDAMKAMQDDPEQASKAELTDVKIEGDTAKGQLNGKESDGSTSQTPVEFKKLGGSWRVASLTNL